MKQEEKQLLLKDLCARLPYGVIVRLDYRDGTIVTREIGIGSFHDMMFDNTEGKPYLRPMSSMTKEEYEEYSNLEEYNYIQTVDFLLSHHFDFRGLIEKGLAIEVTESNNPYKE